MKAAEKGRYEYRGDPRYYPQHRHPGQDGVLVVEPGEIVNFGDSLPPDDGLWFDMDGQAVLPARPSVEDEDESAGTGAGDPPDPKTEE